MTRLSIVSILGLVLATTALDAGATAPLARIADGPVSVSVSYGDLDINNAAEAKVLYDRIVAAAGRVCGGSEARVRRQTYDDCRAQVVFLAVTKVNSRTYSAATRRDIVQVQVGGG